MSPNNMKLIIFVVATMALFANTALAGKRLLSL
jgi:hypothetical protein